MSVDAVHTRLICVLDTAVADRFPGTVGAVISGAAGVVALAVLEYELRFGTASCARTR